MSESNYGATAAAAATKSSNGAGAGGDKRDNDETTSLLGGGGNADDSTFGITFWTEQNASLLSRLLFGWMAPMMRLGNAKGKLDPEDISLIPLPDDCRCEYLNEVFSKTWQEELDRSASDSKKMDKKQKSVSSSASSEPSLIRALFKAFGTDYVVGGFFLKLIHDSCIFVGPQVLNQMIKFLGDEEAPISRGLWLTAAVTMSQLMMSFCLRHYFFKCYKFGLMIRTAVVVAVYQKALVLCAGERHTRSLGEMQNLMSIDAQRLQELTTYLHAVWYSFFQITLALFFLWRQLGASSLAGVAVIIMMMPVTKSVAQWMGGLQRKLMTSKDNRVEVNSEVMSSMKVVKLQAWEEPFIDRIMRLREEELHRLLNYIVAQALSFMLWSAVPLAVALATFAAYVVSGNDLDVATALTSLALFDILRFPLFMLPQIINRMVEAGVSLGRVRSFLLGEDHQPIGPGDLTKTGVKMTNLSAAYESLKPTSSDKYQSDPLIRELEEKKWELTLLQSQLDEAESRIKELMTSRNDPKKPRDGNLDYDDENVLQCSSTSMLCLKRVDFECQPGQLVAVVGGVGCGKSSLLNGVLGELRYLSGSNSVKADLLAFFSQNPFILNATVRDNILFGHVNEPVDEARYQRALQSCALTRDLEILPAGDMTEIGEKGITLSGGQKARVALARAVYHQADISLIDDALSAVDAHVAKHIFDEAIVKELLAGRDGQRSVMLATNALQHLSHPRVDKIVVMQGGRIIEQGTYKELSLDKTSEFSRFLTVIEETGVSAEHQHDDNDDGGFGENLSGKSSGGSSPKASPAKEGGSQESPKKKDNKLMTTEERSIGHVTADVYLYWASKAGGGAWVPLTIIFVYGLVELIAVASKWWLTYWGQNGSASNQVFFLSIYAIINLVNVIAIFLRIIFLMVLGLRASKNIFRNLLEVVMYAPMSFFDTTPIGRVVNRFSQDMYTIDSQLMTALRSYLTTIMNVASTIVVISTVTPVFLICLVPIIMFYGSQQAFFTRTYRELKRLDSVNRSPIFALLGETVDGAPSIRAYNAGPTLRKRMEQMVDLQQNAYYLLCVAQCWLAIRLELVGTLFICLACLLAVGEHWLKGADEHFAGLAGLSITYALSVTQSLNWSVRMASDLEAAMVAVERVREYTQIQDEAPRETEKDNLVKEWPSDGEIVFNNACLRYRPGLPLVLKSLNLVIPVRSKVGVVGRTGAGKSTLMVALMRIVELDSGTITIDGEDIGSHGLSKLRKGIAVIPQDPVLFSGDIRSNLDPFDDFSDADLIDVLTRVGLFTTMDPSSSGISLSSLGLAQINSLIDVVKENGSNFSVGQRQLMVIARALLVGSPIVIMDEATASVDAVTDAQIQKVMRSEFANATTITVAHRINTIMDSTHVLTMDNGQAAEFDTPQNLLKKGGLFRELVRASATSSSSS
mmetsp:Transcript_6110/g.15236  ORF Transcript_6110/g.15236 Transcript_6110/m.15236 type:complete len:1427 (-) Transcript_6110:1683-5963(-)